MTWPKAELGAVCDIVSGATPKTGVAEFWDGDIAWTTPKDLSDLDAKYLFDTPRKLTESGLNSCSASMLPANSVLLSSRAPIGLVAINTIPLCTNQGFKNLIPHKGRLDPEYLYWWLKSQNRELQNLGRGATFKEISKAIVSRIQIPLPPLAEQKRIAGILDAADALRAKRRESIEQLDTLIQSTFLEMFGDPVTNPKGWDMDFLGNHFSFKNGINFRADQKGSGIPTIDVKNMYGTSIFVETDNLYRVDTEPKSEQILKDGDVLFVRSSVKREGVGWACAFQEQQEPVTYCGFIIRGRPTSSHLRKEYILHCLRHPYLRERLVANAGQVAITNISQAGLSRLIIPIPSRQSQDEFARFYRSCASAGSITAKYSTELDTLFASLQSRAFRGEL